MGAEPAGAARVMSWRRGWFLRFGNFGFYVGRDLIRDHDFEVSLCWHPRENPREGEFIFMREIAFRGNWRPQLDWCHEDAWYRTGTVLSSAWTGRKRTLSRFWWPMHLRLYRYAP